MTYENALSKVGDFGLYQKLLCGLLVFYTTFLCGINYYTQVFIFDTPPHRCHDAVVDGYKEKFHATSEDILPWVPRQRGYPSKCSMVDSKNDPSLFLNLTGNYFNNLKLQKSDPDMFSRMTSDVISMVEASPFKKCTDGWTYDHDLIFPTITSQNDWVCDEDWRATMIHTLFWVGNTVGCFVWGFTNDKLGRKPTVLITHAIYFLAGIATLFWQDMIFVCVCRFLVGAAHHTVSHLPYLLVIEYCGVESRTVPLLMVMVSYSTASMTVPWVAMALPSWRYLAALAPTAVLPVLLCWK